MPRLSYYIDNWDTLHKSERQDFGRQLNAIEAKIAAWANQLNQAIGSIVIPVEVPVGGKFVGIFKTACPSGWTRETGFDDKFLRGAATYGSTGGSDTHTHGLTGVVSHTHTGPSHDHGGSTGAASAAHTHSEGIAESAGLQIATGSNYYRYIAAAGTTGTSSGTSHEHSIAAGGTGTCGSTGSATATDAGSTLPAYIGVVFCSKD